MTRPELTVLYNENCPICRAEVAHYRSYADQRGLLIVFEDLNTADLIAWGVSSDDAARRLHVRDADGLQSGLAAFLTLWRALPRYRLLAKVAGAPGIRPLVDWLYNRVLAPWLYRRHLARSAAK